MPESPDTEAIAARAQAATPGEWIASHEALSDIHGFDCQSQVTYPDGHGNYGFTPADADFIAHARQDIPTLLAALATAEERAENAERNAEKAWDQVDDISTDNMQRLFPRLAAAEAVVEAAQRFTNLMYGTAKDLMFTAEGDAIAGALRNYHKATGPQAETERETNVDD